MTEATQSDSLRADIDAAITASEAGPPAKAAKAERPAPKAEPPPVKPEAAANDEAQNDDHAAEPAAEPAEGRQARTRDAFGRFVKNPERAEAAPAEPHANDEHANDEFPDQPETGDAEPEPDGPAIDAPQSWSAAAKDTWSKLPRQAQEEILRRESDIQRGFQQRAEQLKTLEPIAQAVEPYRQKLALRGVNPAQMVGQLLAVHDLLEQNPIEGVAYVARSYGVDLRTYAEAFQRSQQPQDPVLAETSQRVQRLEQLLIQSRQVAEQQQLGEITSEVQAFGQDPAHPYFEDVRPLMAQLMQSGITTSLQDAYDKACRMSDPVRQRIEEDRQRAEQAKRWRAEKDAADRARRTAVSVHASPAGNGATPPKGGSLRDDIRAAIERSAHR